MKAHVRKQRTIPANHMGCEIVDRAHARPRNPKVGAVVPTRNEASNLPLLLPALRQQVDEIIVVDGGSTDGTVQVARQLVPDAVIVPQ